MSNPLISIVIPHYNYREYIVQCLQSCIDQSYNNFQIMFIDDKSDFNVFDYTECRLFYDRVGFLESNTPIAYMQHGENLGYSAAKNTGISATSGQFIVHLDADDLLTPDSLELRVKHFMDNPQLDMVAGRAYEATSYQIFDNELVENLPIDRKTVIHAQGVMIRRSVYERYGLYYEKLRSKADKEMWVRLGVHREGTPKINIKHIDDPVAIYRIHDKSMMAKRRKDKVYADNVNKIYKERIEQLEREGITRDNTRFL